MMSRKKKSVVSGEVERIFKSLVSERNLAKRIDAISARFIDCPYVTNSLVGSPDLPEQLVIKLDGFDCVTYMETVLALALSETAEQFRDNLIRIRYQNGEVEWRKRNHYMVDWWRNNEQQGLIVDLTRGSDSVEKNRELAAIKELPTRRISFRLFPKKNFKRVEKRLQAGDFICFGSTKKSLDVFHAGIIIRRDDKILLRHASRTARKVIEQDVTDFLQNNRMSGLVLLRPTKK
jgi:hypothetical protein